MEALHIPTEGLRKIMSGFAQAPAWTEQPVYLKHLDAKSCAFCATASVRIPNEIPFWRVQAGRVLQCVSDSSLCVGIPFQQAYTAVSAAHLKTLNGVTTWLDNDNQNGRFFDVGVWEEAETWIPVDIVPYFKVQPEALWLPPIVYENRAWPEPTTYTFLEELGLGLIFLPDRTWVLFEPRNGQRGLPRDVELLLGALQEQKQEPDKENEMTRGRTVKTPPPPADLITARPSLETPPPMTPTGPPAAGSVIPPPMTVAPPPATPTVNPPAATVAPPAVQVPPAAATPAPPAPPVATEAPAATTPAPPAPPVATEAPAATTPAPPAPPVATEAPVLGVDPATTTDSTAQNGCVYAGVVGELVRGIPVFEKLADGTKVGKRDQNAISKAIPLLLEQGFTIQSPESNGEQPNVPVTSVTLATELRDLGTTIGQIADDLEGLPSGVSPDALEEIRQEAMKEAQAALMKRLMG